MFSFCWMPSLNWIINYILYSTKNILEWKIFKKEVFHDYKIDFIHASMTGFKVDFCFYVSISQCNKIKWGSCIIQDSSCVPHCFLTASYIIDLDLILNPLWTLWIFSIDIGSPLIVFLFLTPTLRSLERISTFGLLRSVCQRDSWHVEKQHWRNFLTHPLCLLSSLLRSTVFFFLLSKSNSCCWSELSWFNSWQS